MCFILLLTCVIAIANGAVGGVALYEEDVQKSLDSEMVLYYYRLSSHFCNHCGYDRIYMLITKRSTLLKFRAFLLYYEIIPKPKYQRKPTFTAT